VYTYYKFVSDVPETYNASSSDLAQSLESVDGLLAKVLFGIERLDQQLIDQQHLLDQRATAVGIAKSKSEKTSSKPDPPLRSPVQEETPARTPSELPRSESLRSSGPSRGEVTKPEPPVRANFVGDPAVQVVGPPPVTVDAVTSFTSRSNFSGSVISKVPMAFIDCDEVSGVSAPGISVTSVPTASTDRVIAVDPTVSTVGSALSTTAATSTAGPAGGSLTSTFKLSSSKVSSSQVKGVGAGTNKGGGVVLREASINGGNNVPVSSASVLTSGVQTQASRSGTGNNSGGVGGGNNFNTSTPSSSLTTSIRSGAGGSGTGTVIKSGTAFVTSFTVTTGSTAVSSGTTIVASGNPVVTRSSAVLAGSAPTVTPVVRYATTGRMPKSPKPEPAAISVAESGPVAVSIRAAGSGTSAVSSAVPSGLSASRFVFRAPVPPPGASLAPASTAAPLLMTTSMQDDSSKSLTRRKPSSFGVEDRKIVQPTVVEKKNPAILNVVDDPTNNNSKIPEEDTTTTTTSKRSVFSTFPRSFADKPTWSPVQPPKPIQAKPILKRKPDGGLGDKASPERTEPSESNA